MSGLRSQAIETDIPSVGISLSWQNRQRVELGAGADRGQEEPPGGSRVPFHSSVAHGLVGLIVVPSK